MAEEDKKEPAEGSSVTVMPSSVARRPGYMEALRQFQYGETLEESEAGYRKMLEIASQEEDK